jgi:hypothetical protein
MAVRGRHRFVFWLLAVCAALWLVIWRQTDSFRVARQLNEIRASRATLEASRSALEGRTRAASSRDMLIPLAAARFGLREARDSEIIRFPLPAAP